MAISAEIVVRTKPAALFACRWLWLGTMALTGCGSESERSEVFGQVTLGDQNVASGSISFFPDRGHSGPAASTAISDGQYRFDATNGPLPGPHRVVIGIEPSASSRLTQTPRSNTDDANSDDANSEDADSEVALSTAIKQAPSLATDIRESTGEVAERPLPQSEWNVEAIVPAATDPASKQPLNFTLQLSPASTDVP